MKFNDETYWFVDRYTRKNQVCQYKSRNYVSKDKSKKTFAYVK